MTRLRRFHRISTEARYALVKIREQNAKFEGAKAALSNGEEISPQHILELQRAGYIEWGTADETHIQLTDEGFDRYLVLLKTLW